MTDSYSLDLTAEEVETIKQIAEGELAQLEKQLQLNMSHDEQARLYCRAAEFDAVVRKANAALFGRL